ncbi:MAG TPA: peptidoglycan DD-metalloendopeptidase family protein [Bacteroidales bacterium]|nr:peptidoglycan DD-metalloendopeptidase family protein [Bacteroidales bacterium]HPS17226.1 peptidoglycan DD-metalloendopeptidase family protein [Bacteroidales bacterium]
MKNTKNISYHNYIFCFFVFILSFTNTFTTFAQYINDDSLNIYESPNDSIDLTSEYFTDSTGIYFFFDNDSITDNIALSYDSISKAYGGSWSNNDALFLYDKDFNPAIMNDSIKVILQDNEGHCYYEPVPGFITSNFGWRRWQYHYGVDLSLHTGDTVRCAFDGVVRISKWGGGYGNCVVIRHNNGLETLYGHLYKSKVVPNQVLKAGDIIGLGGSTGRSTGPHLHFEIRYLGIAINPNSLIDFKNQTLWNDTAFLTKKSFQYISTYKKGSYASKYTGPGVYYSIKSGDSLSRIAVRYGTSVNAICKLNGIKSTTLLKIGRTIRVK